MSSPDGASLPILLQEFYRTHVFLHVFVIKVREGLRDLLNDGSAWLSFGGKTKQFTFQHLFIVQ